MTITKMSYVKKTAWKLRRNVLALLSMLNNKTKESHMKKEFEFDKVIPAEDIVDYLKVLVDAFEK